MIRVVAALAILALTLLPTFPVRAQNLPSVERGALDQVVRIFDARTGERLTVAQLCERLSKVDAVFLGETHVDRVTHEVEDAIYAGLIALRKDQVILAMEMFETDEQQALDEYTGGAIDEATFRQRVGLWGNYRTGYRPLIERARSHGLTVIGSNVPRRLQAKLRGGKSGFESLNEEERSLLPAEPYPNSPQYWERFERVVRGHAHMITGGGSAEGRLYSTQSWWDNTMGWSCARALAARPGSQVLHVNGGFHSAYGQGTVEQFKRRAPNATAVTVDITTVGDLANLSNSFEPGFADYVVYAQQRARGLNEGTYGVYSTAQLRYRLHVPKGGKSAQANGGGPWPLLIWLSADGVGPRDAMDYWRVALGDEAMIAVVEPPFPQLEDNLYMGGRWFWDASFSEDVGRLQGAISRVYGYLGDYFDVDHSRVAVAGNGAGATVVAATALYRSQLPARMLAVDPKRYTELRNLSLPSPDRDRWLPARGDRADLTVLAKDGAMAWWQEEQDAFASVKLQLELSNMAATISPLASAEKKLRQLLGLSAPADSASGRPVQVLLQVSDAPIAVHWASTEARRRRASGENVVSVPRSGLATVARQFDAASAVEVQWLGFAGEVPAVDLPAGWTQRPSLSAAAFASGKGLPLAPGPFGGTTLVVVPKEASDGERSAWLQLHVDDVLNKRNRFTRLQVAFEEGGESQLPPRTIAMALGEIRDAGRSNVLIVPAMYCADAVRMLSLRAATKEFADQMKLAFRPGLGGLSR